jgi:hypothetical protein
MIMKKYINSAIVLLLIISLSSCFTEETPVTPHEAGDATVNSVTMGKKYDTRVYFDLGTDQVVGSHSIDDWDIGFSCEPGNFSIILNDSKLMEAGDLGQVSIDTPIDPEDTTLTIEWKFDEPTGHKDSTAIGFWYESENGISAVSKEHVYLVYKGINSKSRPQGYVKLMIQSASANEYLITFADPDGTNKHELVVETNEDKNYVYVSFADGGSVIDLEPPKTDWDLLFTKYWDYFYLNDGTFQPYSVSGSLINPYYVKAIRSTLTKPFSADSTVALPFEEITFADVDESALLPVKNIIGYTWKWFDFEQSYYVILSYKTYLISDTDGFLYKLRFTDFYDEDGYKGSPKFEFERL